MSEWIVTAFLLVPTASFVSAFFPKNKTGKNTEKKLSEAKEARRHENVL